MPAERLRHVLGELVELGEAETKSEATGGRPAELWRVADPSRTNEQSE
jgi:hypothetical protein